jgi:hypothetical protein
VEYKLVKYATETACGGSCCLIFDTMQETLEDIAIELHYAIKHIPEQERKSVWFNEYLDRVHADMKIHTKR